MTRTEFLRKQTLDCAHRAARTIMPSDWSTADAPYGLNMRKALAEKMLFDNMPVYIGEQELIVGSRTMYGHKHEEINLSNVDYNVLPTYANAQDTQDYLGCEGHSRAIGHTAPDFSMLLSQGIDGIIDNANKALTSHTSVFKQEYIKGVILLWESVSNWILRYAEHAKEMCDRETDPKRKEELQKIHTVCAHIAHKAPRDFWEAAQLFWFAQLSMIVEQYIFMNYGRVDQFLFPYFNTLDKGLEQQLVDCLLLKMYDGVDIVDQNTGTFSGTLNITLGGVTPEGENAVNDLTFAFISGLSRTRLPDPEVSCRIHSKNPPDFLHELSKLSISGLNCIAYYNDDVWIKSMKNKGLPEMYANDYAFDLCQDMLVPGKVNFYCAGITGFADILLNTLRQVEDDIDFDLFVDKIKQNVAQHIQNTLTVNANVAKAVHAFAEGDKSVAQEMIAQNLLSPQQLCELKSPQQLTSSLFHGCVEQGGDYTWHYCERGERGYMFSNLVVGINSVAALRKVVFVDKTYTLSDVLKACDNNFENNEVMRQILWNAPKWANDDDFVDLPAKEIIEFACDEIVKHHTFDGYQYLAGIHQPHPVFAGRNLQATPEGRKKGEPIPVTLSPENGTMLHGPTAAFQSAAKINPMKSQWNNCVMLSYFSSTFLGKEGYKLFAKLLTDYFSIGGTQHQPNVVDVAQLKEAQLHPEEYKNLIVRMWGVSAHFVDLPKDVQDEFIARFENI